MIHSFTLRIDAPCGPSDHMAESVYAVASDMTLYSAPGGVFVDVDREASSRESAVIGAISDIRIAGYVAELVEE